MFLATIAGPGGVPQHTTACAFVPLIFVSWISIVVSFGPYSSSVTTLIPAAGISFSISRRPPLPKPVLSEREAMRVIFFSLRYSMIFSIAMRSVCGVLKTHFLTGSTMVTPAAQEINGTSTFSMYSITAIVVPVRLGPTMASTSLPSTRRLAAFNVSAGSPLVSSMTISSGRPSTPPASLIIFSTISAVSRSGIPSDEASPVMANMAPITYGGPVGGSTPGTTGSAGFSPHPAAQSIATTTMPNTPSRRVELFISLSSSFSLALRSRPVPLPKARGRHPLSARQSLPLLCRFGR